MLLSIARTFALILVAVAWLWSASAQAKSFSFALDQRIAGVAVSLLVELSVSKGEGNGPLALGIRANLRDLFSKSDQIVDALGVQGLLKGGVTIAHKGTALSIAKGQLHAKVHLELQWRGKILGIKSSASSAGSVMLHAVPVIKENRVALDINVEKPKISNDIVRNAADFLDGREVARNLAQLFFDHTLSDPARQLPLPPQALALGVTLTGARFEIEGHVPYLIIVGSLDNAAAQWLFQ